MKIAGNLLFMRDSAHEEAARCRAACLLCPRFDPDLTQNVGVMRDNHKVIAMQYH